VHQQIPADEPVGVLSLQRVKGWGRPLCRAASDSFSGQPIHLDARVGEPAPWAVPKLWMGETFS
jgi:hypothetical protein